jgi:hypothetical protein
MVQHIAELNRVIITVNSISSSKGIERSVIVDQPDHEETINFCVDIGLLKARGKQFVFLTDQGRSFLDLNPEYLYDLSSEQKRYLIRGFFLDGVLQREVRDCLKCFVESEKKKTFTWSSIDGTPFGQNWWIVSHLEQLGLIEQLESGYSVNKEFTKTVAAFINEPKGYTEAQLLKWLEEKKRLGNIAEEIVLEFERNRLRTLGYVVEASCVKPVGKLKTNAGYDIESYNGKSKNMLFDRFIEVKGSGDPKLRFIWSQNEIKIAEKLGNKYWIYYQGGINKKTGKTLFKPIMIQDPFNSIETDSRLIKTPNGVVVVGVMRGEQL